MKKIVWVVRGIKDYRIPVYNALSGISDVELHLIYNPSLSVSDLKRRLSTKIRLHEIDRELLIGPKDNNERMANTSIRVTYVPGIIPLLRRLRPHGIIVEGFFQYSLFGYVYKILTPGVKLICSYERTIAY